MPSIVFVCDSRLRLASIAALYLMRDATQRRLPPLDVQAATFSMPLPPMPVAVRMVMAESGFDLATHQPKPLTRDLALATQRIVWLTIDGPPPKIPIESWDVRDPQAPERAICAAIHSVESVESARAALAEARSLRDRVSERVAGLADQLERGFQFVGRDGHEEERE